jgi:hypothetical protein
MQLLVIQFTIKMLHLSLLQVLILELAQNKLPEDDEDEMIVSKHVAVW